MKKQKAIHTHSVSIYFYFICILAAGIAHGQIYKCELADGSVVFQETICDSDDVVNVITYEGQSSQEQANKIFIGERVITTSKLDLENTQLNGQQLTDWMHKSDLQALLDDEIENGYFNLYTESKGNERRMLLHPTPIGMSWSSRSGRPEGKFISFNEKFTDEGKKLLTLHVYQNPDNNRKYFSATWVSKDRFSEAIEICEKYGITIASIADS